ncbi:hypothetical protein [Amycolatopsis thermoflava]|uniref:Uncharacterized protein n=1 Tax=Amycolatopsis thermoflava TaxID=84480 RepID=A0A3N2GQA7_9PSEU|nr:hypothetical protein [Amycolatopsis thermoflava]ROS38409.1 hypothetical protein EDD35_0683 [Amycolatopsis thermoflava]
MGIDVYLHHEDFDITEFHSHQSIFDFDVAFWDPPNSAHELARTSFEFYQGASLLSENLSAAIPGHISRRRSEFRSFLELGRTLVVFAGAHTQLCRDTGKRNYSGTGKNRVTTRLVEPVSLLDTLPVSCEFTPSSGTAIEVKDQRFSSVYQETKRRWSYRAILEGEITHPLAVIRGTDKPLGAIYKFANQGMLIILPDFQGPAELDDEEVEFESIPYDEYAGKLIGWVASLRGDSDARIPDWMQHWSFPEQVARRQALRDLQEDVDKILQKMEELKSADAEEDAWKILATGSGNALEIQAQKAFEALGFEVQESKPGRSDLRMRYDETAIVAEVKGVKKSATEGHAAQLEKWVAEEISAGRGQPKAILIVNAWREKPLDERSDPVFPDQMLPYSEARGHCLVSGLQLLNMARIALEQPEERAALARKLLNTVGVMQGHADLTQIFAPKEEAIADHDTADSPQDCSDG